jgi:outer membrane protein OmpA-like peptidoglycan-associated protein/tetratricopeptide (TPR) repeat protein
MRHLFYLLPFILLSHSILSQEEDEKGSKKLCNEDIPKKVLALYEKGTDKKKYKKPERLKFLMEAITAEPDFAEANLAMGLELAARCKLEEKAFTPTLPFFYKAIAVCPQVHSEPYYYIGFDYYERAMYDSAVKYLPKFIAFKDEDEKKFAKDWEAEMYQAKMMLRDAKKAVGLKKNMPFEPKVVTGVSTERDEYLAYISPDDKSCYFVRRVPFQSMNQVSASDKEKELFMVAQRDKTGQFNKGEAMSAPFNATDDNQGGCTISIDNKNLYFAMMRMEGGLQPNCDLYVSSNQGGDWSEITKLSANVNHPKYWDSQPTIAADGLTLYFASDRPGGYGGIDLYVTKKDPKTGIWSAPQNLGPNINTPGDEKTPFIHSDSETLYFSSNGHFGFGGYDIFLVRADDKGVWGESENIGSPINGPTDDTGFFVSSDTRTGYFFSYEGEKVRTKAAGRYDLYGFELYKEARPTAIRFAKGSVKDSTGNQVSGAIVEIKDVKTKQTTFATVDSASGDYMVAIKMENDVVLTVKKDDIAFNIKQIKIADIPPIEAEPLVVNIEVNEAKKGSSFVIDHILYTTNSAEIASESKVILENFAQYLKENPSYKIQIEGHTDNVGNIKDNEALSTNRAFSVKAMLEEFGVDGKRILAKGYGPSKPLADNNREEGRAKNRRTEFLILEK